MLFGEMNRSLSFLFLFAIGSVVSLKCPDGEIAAFKCNQKSKICEGDTSLSCHPINGIHYCCADPIRPKSSIIEGFRSEIQHQQAPNDDEDPTKTITTTVKPPDGEEECKDTNPETCVSVQNMCDSKVLKDMLKAQCRLSCKFCCADKRKECPQWEKYQFCSSDQITKEKKAELCPKTCNLCPQLRV